MRSEDSPRTQQLESSTWDREAGCTWQSQQRTVSRDNYNWSCSSLWTNQISKYYLNQSEINKICINQSEASIYLWILPPHQTWRLEHREEEQSVILHNSASQTCNQTVKTCEEYLDQMLPGSWLRWENSLEVWLPGHTSQHAQQTRVHPCSPLLLLDLTWPIREWYCLCQPIRDQLVMCKPIR